MRKSIHTSFIIAFMLLLTGCAGLPMLEEKPTEKIYNVVFEGEPAIASGEVVSGEKQIGEVLNQTQSKSGLTLAAISIDPEHQELMQTNASFYAANNKLHYTTLADTGEPLKEGDKVLGFTSKTQLYWHKTKSSISGAANAAMEKAKELYNNSVAE